MAQPALVYDPRGHTFESWAALMCEAYAAQQLQIDATEEHWKDWAAGLKAIDVFTDVASGEFIRTCKMNNHFFNIMIIDLLFETNLL